MSMQPWQTSLAYAPLQPAFTRWVEGEGHDMAAWVDPEQQVPALDLCVGSGSPGSMHAGISSVHEHDSEMACASSALRACRLCSRPNF